MKYNMGFKLITDDKPIVVYRKEKISKAGNPYVTYCTKASSKDANGEWQSAFLNIKFKKGVEVGNKAKITIKNSFPTVDSYNGNNTLSWMIMDFDIVDNGEGTGIPASVADFMQIDDSIDEELPFK